MLRKLNLADVNFHDVSQSPNTILSYYSIVPGIHGQKILSLAKQQDDSTHIRLSGEKGKFKSGARLQPKTSVIEGHTDDRPSWNSRSTLPSPE